MQCGGFGDDGGEATIRDNRREVRELEFKDNGSGGRVRDIGTESGVTDNIREDRVRDNGGKARVRENSMEGMFSDNCGKAGFREV